MLEEHPYLFSPYKREYTMYHEDEKIGTSTHQMKVLPDRAEGLISLSVDEEYEYSYRPGESHIVHHVHEIVCKQDLRLDRFTERTQITDQLGALDHSEERWGRFEDHYLFLTLRTDELGDQPKERKIYVYLEPYSSLVIEYYIRTILSDQEPSEWLRFFNCGELAFTEERIRYHGLVKTVVNDQTYHLHYYTSRNKLERYTVEYFYNDQYVLYKMSQTMRRRGRVEIHLYLENENLD